MKAKRKPGQIDLENIKTTVIFQYATMGILIVNENGTIVQVNPFAEKMFHYDKNELLGTKVESLIPKRFSIKHESHREVYNKSPHARIMGKQLELFGARKDGTEFPVDISLSPYKTTQGHFIVAFITDNTLRKEEEFIISEKTKELQRLNKELERINKDLIALMYVSSHDLQEPLRKIKNFISFLLREENEKLSENGKRYFQQTYETAIRMQKIIEDLLDFFRANNSDRMLERINLNTIIEEVIKDYDDIIKEKKAIIKTDTPCEINVIRFQIQQLIHNLINNALKFCPSDRSPQINIKSEIKLGSKLKNEQLSSNIKYCHFIIRDNGIGFDPQYKEKIFEIFQRLNDYNEYKGTGIGLAICKRIVENHNGIITATGKVNKGAKFDIYIPAE